MRHHTKFRGGRGGNGWGFDLMTLQELLALRDDTVADKGRTYPADQIGALADAILEAQQRDQIMTLKIAGAEASVMIKPRC